jgi:hypothetical protein
MQQFGLLLRLADWTQIRYVQAAPLSALEDPDLHNWSVKGKANTSWCAPRKDATNYTDPSIGPVAVRIQITVLRNRV